jgi:hypothetical protein
MLRGPAAKVGGRTIASLLAGPDQAALQLMHTCPACFHVIRYSGGQDAAQICAWLPATPAISETSAPGSQIAPRLALSGEEQALHRLYKRDSQEGRDALGSSQFCTEPVKGR